MPSIKKDISFLLSGSFLAKALNIIKGFIVIRFLTPEMYALVDIIRNITNLAKYGDLGFISVIEREFNYYSEEEQRKSTILNVGATSETVLAIILSLLVLGTAFFYLDNRVIGWGIVISSATLFFTKIQRIFETYLRISKKFKEYAQYIVIAAFVLNVGVIITVPLINVWAPIIFPLISSAIIVAFMIYKLGIPFTINWNKKEIIRQIRVGLLLGGLTFMTGLTIYLERFLVVKKFGLASLGLYAVFAFLLNSYQYFLKDVTRAYVPRTLESLGKKEKSVLLDNVMKPSPYIVGISLIIIVGIRFLLPILVFHFFPKYFGAIDIIILLSPLILTVSLTNISGYILYAPSIEKFKRLYISWGITLLVMSSYLFVSIFFEMDLIGLVLFFLIARVIGHLIIYGSVLSIVYGALRGLLICIIVLKIIGVYTIIYLYEINYI